MPSNVGTQTITVKFFDPVDSPVANRIALDLRKVGIYSGGYLTRVNDTTVTLTALTCEIGDGTYQIRAKTADSVNITIGSATPYIILRWTYTGSESADYMELLAVASGSILSTDLVVGKGVFTGSTLSGTFDYTLRTNPLILDLFCKVEPTVAASMYTRIRGGRVNYGGSAIEILDQLSPLFSAPVSNSRIDLLQINTSGGVIITTGTAAATPVAPAYGNLITLAEVTLVAGMTTITVDRIRDTRGFLGGINPVPGTILSGLTGIPSSAGVIPLANLPAPAISGAYKNLNVSRPSITQVTVTADELVVADTGSGTWKATSVNVTAAITTSGANGLDTPSEASSTWYYIWVIRKSTDGTLAALLSTSSTAPTMPSGYDQKALVSAVRNDGSSNFVDFVQVGKYVTYKAGIRVVTDGSSPAAWTAIDMTSTVPSGVSSLPFGTISGMSSYGHVATLSNLNTETTDLYGLTPNGIGSGWQADSGGFAGFNGNEFWRLQIFTANTLYYTFYPRYVYVQGFEINKLS